MTKRVCQRATSLSLPCVVLHGLLHMLDDAGDVVAFLEALPVSTLPPELIALRDLGDVGDLDEHWPEVHVVDVPIEYARLAIDALPAFASVKVDAGFTALAWLGATLPPTMPVSLVVNVSVPGNHAALAYFWGTNVVKATVTGPEFGLGTIPDILARCVRLQYVTIEGPVTAANLAAIPTASLRTLKVTAPGQRMVDVTAIIAWLQGRSATSLSLDCDSVTDPVALASAIHASSTLHSLSFTSALDVQEALVASPHTLHHITALSVHVLRRHCEMVRQLLQKLDPNQVVSVSVDLDEEDDEDDTPHVTQILNIVAAWPALASLSLDYMWFDVTTTTGIWPQLATIAVRNAAFSTYGDVVKFMQQLSVSRCLTSVDFRNTEIGTAGFIELARALPAWMARGLETLKLLSTQIGDDDVAALAVALASGRNTRHLTLDLSENELTLASIKLLLTALGACHNVTLHVDEDESTPTIRALMEQHHLVETSLGVFVSPTRASTPWHAM